VRQRIWCPDQLRAGRKVDVAALQSNRRGVFGADDAEDHAIQLGLAAVEVRVRSHF